MMRTSQGPFPMEAIYTWTAVTEDMTRMPLRNRGGPTGFSRLMEPFMAQAIRRANCKDLAKLRSMLERPQDLR